MTKKLPPANNKEAQTKSAPFSLVLRWAPAVILFLTAASLLIMFLAGGMNKVIAWYAFQLVLPALGLVFLLAVFVYAIVGRQISRSSLVTGILALLCITPVKMLVSPGRYPASIDEMQPAATVRLPANELLKVGWGGDT